MSLLPQNFPSSSYISNSSSWDFFKASLSPSGYDPNRLWVFSQSFFHSVKVCFLPQKCQVTGAGFPIMSSPYQFFRSTNCYIQENTKNRLLQVFSAFKLIPALLFIGISKSVSLKIKIREPLINPCLILTNINPCLIQQILQNIE